MFADPHESGERSEGLRTRRLTMKRPYDGNAPPSTVAGSTDIVVAIISGEKHELHANTEAQIG